MGVSLERVQFKFASIIGELCSEPVVLSQFAVWLDLRLAEYKSKGAISLDCSGEKPDPSWLKGLRAAAAPVVKRVLGSRLAPRTGVGFSRGGMYSRSSTLHRRNLNSHGRMANTGLAQSHSQPNSQSDIKSRLSGGDMMSTAPEHLGENSDDVVVIKDEPSGDSPSAVYPVSLHSHQSDEPDSRKRPARDSVSSDTQDNSSTPYKVRKTPTDDSPLNQSLMSVLGSTFDDQNPDVTNNSSMNEMDYSVSLQDQTEDSANFQSWADNSANFQSSGPHTSSTSTFSPNPRPSATVTSNSSLAEGSISTDTEQAEANVLPDAGRIYWSPTLESQTSQSRQAVVDPGRSSKKPKAKSTYAMFASCVGTLERWIREKFPGEQRKIETIPPVELDSYLADFFLEVKKPSGWDYSPESLRSLRSYIQGYLENENYPMSITKCPAFLKSQKAYNQRRNQLRSSKSQKNT